MKVHSLPISVSDLLDRHIVESERLELKAGWDSSSDKPNSRNQQYRITDKGRQALGVVK
jgi:predicted transcriptional regulator